ncbi:MAG: winged helix DNA-binding domain-containing protein [Myxococcota bacterium]
MIEVSEEQVRDFRGRRGQLTGDGAPDPAAATHAVVGIQAQVEGSTWWAVSMRTAARPTARALKQAWQVDRTLVRTWAQRDTLHLFGPHDWPWFAAANRLWSQTGRGPVRAPDDVLDQARKRLREAPRTRTDLLDLVTPTMRAEMAERVGEDQADRHAAGRIPWQLAHLGEICLGPKRGAEQSYAHRDHWRPDLAEAFGIDPTHAAVALTRRYLGVHGPATAKDVAHFFGARAPLARDWVGALADETTLVRCGERELVVLRDDLPDLRREPSDPPARLLAAYDTVLMAHADKSWTTPVEAERKAVWKRSAVVVATVLHAGRVVGVWRHQARKSGVTVTVQPLSGFTEGARPGIEADAERLAAHLEVEGFTVVIDG